MKELLKSKISNSISMVVMILFVFGCCLVYAADPTGHISKAEQDLLNAVIYLSPCASKNNKLENYIKGFKRHLMEVCEEGGILEAVDSKGNPILFYCSRVIET